MGAKCSLKDGSKDKTGWQIGLGCGINANNNSITTKIIVFVFQVTTLCDLIDIFVRINYVKACPPSFE
jgi:hypothetical protein